MGKTRSSLFHFIWKMYGEKTTDRRLGYLQEDSKAEKGRFFPEASHSHRLPNVERWRTGHPKDTITDQKRKSSKKKSFYGSVCKEKMTCHIIRSQPRKEPQRKPRRPEEAMAAKVPKKYTKGLGESTQDRRRAEIRKRLKGKKSFEPLPGDARAKTRESRYTKRIKDSGLRKVIQEETTKGKGSTRERFIKAVARVTDIPKPIIQEVYNKGLAAWAVGHRPGATQDQWARARMYSFLSKGRTTETADKQLFIQAKEALKKKGKRFNF